MARPRKLRLNLKKRAQNAGLIEFYQARYNNRQVQGHVFKEESYHLPRKHDADGRATKYRRVVKDTYQETVVITVPSNV